MHPNQVRYRSAHYCLVYWAIHSGGSGSSLPFTFTPRSAAQRYPHIGPYFVLNTRPRGLGRLIETGGFELGKLAG